MENKSLKIGIFGLGLIGGSILKGLYDSSKYHLTAVSKSSYKKAQKFCDISSNDISILKNCNVVFVCSKMSDTPHVLAELEEILPGETIVADVCSIKGFLEKKYKFNFIPTHPMAGTEFFGFENSFSTLFKGAKWVVGSENKILYEIIETLGAKPVLMKADEHDACAAFISHFPAIASMALFNSASESAKSIAASGFRDTTRLAVSNPDLSCDMLKFNRKNILIAYEKFKNEFEKILGLEENEFKNFAKIVAQKRAAMYDKNGKNVL